MMSPEEQFIEQSAASRHLMRLCWPLRTLSGERIREDFEREAGHLFHKFNGFGLQAGIWAGSG